MLDNCETLFLQRLISTHRVMQLPIITNMEKEWVYGKEDTKGYQGY